jgi:hypothetical protein
VLPACFALACFCLTARIAVIDSLMITCAFRPVTREHELGGVIIPGAFAFAQFPFPIGFSLADSQRGGVRILPDESSVRPP